jgi:hypothetical protein
MALLEMRLLLSLSLLKTMLFGAFRKDHSSFMRYWNKRELSHAGKTSRAGEV